MDRTNLGDNFCETNTNEFHERTNLTYSNCNCQLIKHFEHFPNCSMGEFIGINIRGNLELPCKPKNIMECNKVSPFDGLNGDKNYYSKIDFGCKRECKRTHYKMDITVGDVDLIPFQKYVESGQNTSINASKL